MQESQYRQAIYHMFSKIVGCAFESYNFYHDDVDELTYEAGFYMELVDADFTVHRQEKFPIYYKGRPTPVRRQMDLVVTDKNLGNVVIELKAIKYVGDDERRQLWSYMKLMHIRFGFLVNFSPKGVFSESWELDEETGRCKRV